jgi:type IV secretory pathway TrbF-like protein
MKTTSVHSPKTKIDTTGYSDAARMYVEYSASYQQASVMWRRFAFSAMMVASLSIVGNIFQAQLPRQLPYVITEKADGSTDAGTLIRPAEKADAPWVKYQLSRWITEARSVSSDPTVQALFHQHTALLILNGSPAAATVGAYYQGLPAAADSRTEVKMNYIRPRDGMANVYEADWSESTLSRDGHDQQTEHWNAVISIEFSSGNITLPSGDDPDYSNPFGMYISNLTWNREAT